MTVSSDLNRISYTGNGTTTVFPVNYYFLENSHLLVVLRSATGVETVQTLTTNYTVTGAGNEAGGSVTMLVAPPVGTTLVIQRDVPATQETDYLANDPFPAESHERALDKLTMLVQQNESANNRSIKIPITETSNTQVPNSVTRANKVLGFSAGGDVAITNSNIAQIDAAVASFVNATGNNAASILYDPAGLAAVQTTVQAKLRETVSVKDFGAVGDGVADDTAAIQAALNAAAHVVVPSGLYRCDGMIELNSSKTLQLMGGATLSRLSAFSASTDPVVWIKESSASFIGAGQRVSRVTSQNRAPKGVVRLGHKDITESHANVTYCTLKDMEISGSLSGGQTTGDPDVALYMPNPQFSGLVSYFHNIFGLHLVNANIGMWLHGWANGNTISNIQGFRLGNTTLNITQNIFIYCNGGLDNSISNVFFHQSTNSQGLRVETLDNTSNGGVIHFPSYNSFRGIICEQGGPTARALVVLDSGRSFYEIRPNTAGGVTLPAGFLDTNHFFGFGTGVNATSGVITTLTTTTLTTTTSTNTSEQIVTGTLRQGDSSVVYVAKKVKRNESATAASLTFTLSCAAQASLWRHGYIRIKVAGGTSANTLNLSAEYLFDALVLNQAFPDLGAVSSSSGDDASFTIAMTSGVLTITPTASLNNIVAEVEFAFTTSNINIT